MARRSRTAGANAPPGLQRLWQAREARTRHAALSTQAHHVLILLVAYADKDGTCYPSIATLAARSGLSPNSVIKGLKQLKETKLISVRPREHRNGGTDSNLYTIADVSRSPGVQSPVRSAHRGYARGAPKERHLKRVIKKKDMKKPEESKKRPTKRLRRVA